MSTTEGRGGSASVSERVDFETLITQTPAAEAVNQPMDDVIAEIFAT